MRLGDAYDRARAALRAAGLDTPDLDARVLTAAAAGIPPGRVLLEKDRTLSGAQAATLDAHVARRLAREPVSRILGTRDFWGLNFALGPDTLDPRPDTETLVEAALDALRAGGGLDRAVRIADLGTGTGAILAAVLSDCPNAVGIAVDRSEGAAAVAAANLDALGLGARGRVVVGDWAAALAPDAFDLILSNPPYIASAEIATLDPEVARHDPRLALDGGADGLCAYRALLPGARSALRPGGRLLLEVGETQAADVTALLAEAGYLPGGPARADLAGVARVVSGLAPE